MKLIKLNISAIAIFGLLLLSAWHLQAQTTTIISDPFTGSAGILLNGSAPQDHGGTGADAWIEQNNDIVLTGTNAIATNAVNENAFLPFTPANGSKYLLSADLNPFASAGDWFAIGFAQNANDGQWHNSGNNASGWILARGAGSGQTGQTFLGPETGGGAAIGTYNGQHNYSVVLDTTLVNWTFQFFVDGVSVRGPVAYSGTVGVNPTINYVGFGHLQSVLGTVDNFSLTTIPQTKISDPFTGSSGTFLNGSAPQDHGGTGADAWIQPPIDMVLTGTNVICTNGINENAFLPFTPANGSKYLLSADLNAFASGGDRFAIGFAQNANNGQWHNSGNNASGWILARGAGSGQTGQTFLGPETGGGAAIGTYNGQHNYSVVLDTTLVNWTFQFFVDGVSVRGPVAYSGTVGVNPTINYVGFGHLSGVLGTVDNFKMQTIPQTKISDPFTGSSGTFLNGSAPQDHGGTGADAWIQPPIDMVLTGTNVICTNGINENAFLPFTPSAGNIYLLSADLNAFASGGDWFAIGFAQNANNGQWHNSGNNASGWILARGAGSGQTGQTFLGPETGGGAAIGTYNGQHNYSVVLDTTLVNWTFQFFVDGVSVRGPVAYSGTVGVNPTINYVGFGHLQSVLGTVDNFSLTTIPQTKISDPFTGSSGTFLNGSAPQDHGGTGADAWIQPPIDMVLTGTNVICTNGINENAFLPFTPSAGNIYLLSADLNAFASGGDWFAIGFAQNANNGQWHNSGNNASGWMLPRGAGSGPTGQTFLGPETGGGAAIGTYNGQHNYSVVLD